MNRGIRYLLVAATLSQALMSCGNVPGAPSAITPEIQRASRGQLKTQSTLAEQQATVAALATLAGIGWVSININSYKTGPILQTNIQTVLTEMITDSFVNGDGLDEYYLGLYNQPDLSRLAEVFLTLEGTAEGLTRAAQAIGDGTVFRTRMVAVTAVVLQEKSENKKIKLSLEELLKQLSPVNTGDPQAPKPGDPCYKGFEKDGKWNDASTLLKHTEDHAQDFGLSIAEITPEVQEAYAKVAQTLFQRAVQAAGKGFDVLVRENGDLLIGEASSGFNGKFGVYSPSGGARSVYVPDDTYSKYFERQKQGDNPGQRPSEDWNKGEKGTIGEDGECR